MPEQDTPSGTNAARRLVAAWLFACAATVAVAVFGRMPEQAVAAVLLLPLAGFAAAGMIDRRLAWRLAAVFALGLAQALLPEVAARPIAAIILGALMWSGLDVALDPPPLRRGADSDARRMRWTVAAALVLMLAALPAPIAVHQALALAALALLSASWLKSRRLAIRRGARVALGLATVGAWVQAGVGLATLLHRVPEPLAAAHQVGALALFGLLTWTMHAVRA